MGFFNRTTYGAIRVFRADVQAVCGGTSEPRQLYGIPDVSGPVEVVLYKTHTWGYRTVIADRLGRFG